MDRGSKVWVIGPNYCTSKPVELDVPMPDHDHTGTVLVRNINNDVIFTIEDTTSFRLKRVLLDSAGTTILTLREKILSLHFRWKVYMGSSTDKNDLIFAARECDILGSDNIELDVFLPGNKSEKKCDFKVGRSSGVIYTRDYHGNIIAEMRGDRVKVYPGVDQAFIISLIVIQDGINYQRSSRSDAIVECITFLIAILVGIKLAGTASPIMVSPIMVLLHILKTYMQLKRRKNNDDESQHHHAMPTEEKVYGNAPRGMGARHRALPVHNLKTYTPLIIDGLSLLMN